MAGFFCVSTKHKGKPCTYRMASLNGLNFSGSVSKLAESMRG